MTHRIEPLFTNVFQYDSQSWIFVNMTQRTEYPFWNMSHRNEPFLKNGLQELALSFRGACVTLRIETLWKIWLTLRIQHFWTFSCDSKNWTFFTWLKDLSFFFKNLTFMNRTFFSVWLQQLNFFFSARLKYDSQNWTFFLKQRLKELKFFLKKNNDSKDCPFFFNMTQRLEPSFLNVTFKNSTFWKRRLKE